MIIITICAGIFVFTVKLEHKLEEHGGQLIKIPRFYPSSQTCSCCGFRYPAVKDLREAWECPECGAKHDRDYNAAVNILAKGSA